MNVTCVKNFVFCILILKYEFNIYLRKLYTNIVIATGKITFTLTNAVDA